MKNNTRLLCLFLTLLLLFGSATACGGGVTEPPTQEPLASLEATESETEPTVETETLTSETDPISPPEFQTGELSLEERKDLFPSFEEKETWTEQLYEAIEIRVEAESYAEATIPISYIAEQGFGGGKMLQSLCVAPAQGWDYTYAISYRVDAPKQGKYRLVVLSSDLQKEYTSDYFLDVNGERVLTAAEGYTILEHFSCAFDAALFKVMDLGTLTLSQGENVITFTVDNADSQNAWNRISFFLDYFELTYENDDVPQMGCAASYAVTPTGKNAETLLAAQTVNVFDCRYPLCLEASLYTQSAGEVSYSVTDYYGNTLYAGRTKASGAGQIVLKRTLKDHPTGYFTLTIGDLKYHYVVLNGLDEEMPEDSPFAMDYAAYYLVKDPEKTFAIASAARMAGVTWVRDRADWRTYEATKGQYDFTSTEAVYRAIDAAGLKNLVMLCAAPSWATDPLNPNGMAGGFLYTQQDIYQTTKAMVTYYKDIVDAWELWNESDHGFALETAELYAAWYKAAALGVYAADPEAIISFGGLCQPDTNSDYMHLMLMNDLLDYSSVFNYHAHVPQGTTIPDFTRLPMVSGTYGTLSHFNTHRKPIWVTEAGMKIMTTKPTADDLSAQAPYIVTSAVQSLSMETDKHFWFVLSPYVEDGGDFGTFSSDFQPHPTLAAESTMTHVLGKGQYLGELYDVPEGAYGYVFFTGSRAASVLWAGNDMTYTFDAEKAVIVTNLMGKQTLVKPQNGKISLEIGVDPIFVTYSVAPAYQNKQTEISIPVPLQFDLGQKVIVYPEFVGYDINDGTTKHDGHKIADGTKVILHIVNFNDIDVTGRIEALLQGFTISGCEKEISVLSMDKAVIELTLHKTSEESVETYAVFSGEFNGVKTSRATAHVYTDTPAKNSTARFSTVREGKTYGAEVLSDVGIKWGRKEGVGVAYVNGDKITTVNYENNELTIDLSALSEGKHTVTAGILTPSGDLIYTVFYVTYLNGKVTFMMA